MVLTVHHLGISQSERIVWLCEELGIQYDLVKHTRAPTLAPESLKSVPGNLTGKAPFIIDSDANVSLNESAAIAEYIITRYGFGKLALKPDHKEYVEYLRWFHFANGSLHPVFSLGMFMSIAEGRPDSMAKQLAEARLHTIIAVLDERLGTSKWLAGDDFTAADVMTLYVVSTQRWFGPLVNLGKYGNLLRWMRECGERPAYKRAMEKGDPDMKLLLGAEPPEKSLLMVEGTNSDIWKK